MLNNISRTGKKHKTWNPDQTKLAIHAVREKEMGYLKASKVFDVPKSTLEDYAKQFDKTQEQLVAAPIGRRPVLSLGMEEDLFPIDWKCIVLALRKPQGISKARIKGFTKGFFKRPENISKARIKGFTPENINKFFDVLEPAMEKINYNPSRLYNVDESGITTVQSKNSRVITLKCKKQVGTVTAAERGALVTGVFCMNPVGGFVPPLFVFPRKNMKAELLDGAPPGTIAACHPSAWIQQHIFSQWLQHFIGHVKPSLQDPVLLILDGRYSHTSKIQYCLSLMAAIVTQEILR
ncbi:CENP-B N-terminal DNA-binding domain [Popillia japonica]|uniref:CENP-B N-terminal DNA-binding domain n=1 Tax=Popillia japonica TaxID=7064 RepID=A0AAW1HFW9_POPJA